MTQEYDVEMLRQYFYEQDLSLSTIKKILDIEEMPFDGYYSKWEKETQFENSLFNQYIKKNKIISFDQRIVEITNHINNSVLTQFSTYPASYIFTSSYNIDNKEMCMDYSKRKYCDILVAKGIYQNLYKVLKFYLSANKDVLIGICRNNDDYYERAISYYKYLKSNLEGMSNSIKFTEIEDQIEFSNVKKKIYLLKSE